MCPGINRLTNYDPIADWGGIVGILESGEAFGPQNRAARVAMLQAKAGRIRPTLRTKDLNELSALSNLLSTR